VRLAFSKTPLRTFSCFEVPSPSMILMSLSFKQIPFENFGFLPQFLVSGFIFFSPQGFPLSRITSQQYSSVHRHWADLFFPLRKILPGFRQVSH